MINYARQNPEEKPEVALPPAEDHIAPAPRVSVQAFCETVETAAAVQSAGEDRRLGCGGWLLLGIFVLAVVLAAVARHLPVSLSLALSASG